MDNEKKSQQFERYEQVADFLLDRFPAELDLERVEGKQKLVGKSTEWEIDGKGVKTGPNQGIVVVQAKRYTTKRVAQGEVGELAFVIDEVGGVSGIIVSPLGLQKGAKLVAAAKNITEVHLDQISTTAEYVLKFLNKIFVGASDVIAATDEAAWRTVRGNGTVEESQ